jgi:hypothetical protein
MDSTAMTMVEQLAKTYRVAIIMAMTVCAIIGIGIIGGIAISAIPSRWDGAVVVKVCDGRTAILRLPDGSIWWRSRGLRTYRVENENVCD